MNNFHRAKDAWRRQVLLMDRRMVDKGLRQPGQTVDLTESCLWTTTGRDGQGRMFKTCTIHGEHKVVSE